MEKDEPSDPPNQFEYMQLVYNLLGDMLFYRSPNIAKGLDILYYAKDNVHNGDIKMINHINQRRCFFCTKVHRSNGTMVSPHTTSICDA